MSTTFHVIAVQAGSFSGPDFPHGSCQFRKLTGIATVFNTGAAIPARSFDHDIQWDISGTRTVRVVRKHPQDHGQSDCQTVRGVQQQAGPEEDRERDVG